MRSLLPIILFLLSIGNLPSQNPHGADFKTNCASCHSSAGWEINADYWLNFDPTKPTISRTTGRVLPVDTSLFHHGKTNFELKGRHAVTDCRACHQTLVFTNTSSECVSCHTDMHQQTVGTDCARCHNLSNWLVDNVSALHQENGFPLTGVHTAISCEECHTSASALQFNRIGNDCISCHRNDFNASTNPNHLQAGFSTECLDCHNVFTPGWGTDKVKHDFFPLTKGHEIADCAKCHIGGNYTSTPTNCVACHQPDFQNAASPNHVQAGFSNDCAQCHTIDPDWMPAQYLQHDVEFFPIYSGKHLGQWSQCVDCHINPANFAIFTCTSCHVNPETNNVHNGINGYVYESSACLACHPTGDGGTGFDHNTTGFPLTGAHLTADCIECHAAGYVGTPTQCSACHTTDFNQTTNPNHVALNLPTDCASCHTTQPGWEPATFAIHNNYYALNGAHAVIANDCATCHNGNYNNTPNTCFGCHTADYSATTNPNHAATQFPTDCATCHTESAWAPATFNHNSIYPIVGAHVAIANDCNACHNGSYTNTPNTCAGCHTPDYNQTTDPNHTALQFSTDCATCHTQSAWSPATFDHDAQYFPIYSGKHNGEWSQCVDCHTNPANYAEFTCTTCHANPETNNQHNGVGGYVYQSTACLACHPTGSAANVFDHNNSAFPLTGAHLTTDCLECHANGYQGTPTNCSACHTTDYNQSVNPNHIALNLPTDCANCHTTQPGWEPATFAIHNNYYALNGAHATIANNCATCHNGNYNNTPNTCVGCHIADYNATTNPNHAVSQFPTDCATCHTETAWAPSVFNHNTVYPLTGAHLSIANNCNACHNGNYNNTPNTCAGCHTPDYNSSTNPNHVSLAIPADCAMCHTTDPNWDPALFPIHNNYYQLNGAHAAIANNCAVCHNGNYNNTPNTCFGCHASEYNSANNPNHASAQFPTTCQTCHSETAWSPSTFQHDQMYFPIYSGKHKNEWNQCNECHTTPNNYVAFSCIICHEHKNQAQMANKHQGVSGYSFSSPACYNCHPNGSN